MPLSKETAFAALRRLAALPPDSRPDEELLSKFVADRNEAAFTAIVARHGGLVLDVCRSVLRNEADAEDAFQATFIALANDARRIRRTAALAGWLHAVAFRTAAKARRGRDRRRLRETRMPARSSPGHDPSWLEVRLAIHEEVNRLPDRYRAAVVLFYLADRTQDQVGRTLGLSTAGVKKRLERGRALLRSALDRRGFWPLSVLAVTTFSLPVPTTVLARQAAKLAIGFVTTRGGVPAAILSLASAGVRPLYSKTVIGVAAFLGIAAVIGIAVHWGGPPDLPRRPGETPLAYANAARERPNDISTLKSGAPFADAVSGPTTPSPPVVRIDFSEWVGEGLSEALQQRLQEERPGKSRLSFDFSFSEVRGDVLSHLEGLEDVQELCGISATDRELKYLRNLPNLESIGLSGAVTTNGVLQLRASHKLKHLGLSGIQPPIDDKAIEQIVTAWPNLESLSLESSTISDIGLSHVGRLRRLQHLIVSRTQITDDGLKSLVKLSRLTTLHADNTNITDRGMAHLEKMTSLEKLDLNFTGITDEGLTGIHRLTNLRRIYFCGTDVTDKGLDCLKPLKKIEFVGPSYKNSSAAVEALKDSLPLFKKNNEG